MNFIELTTIADQTLVITPRYAGQVIRLGGVETVTQAEVPVRVQGSGVVEISEGYWDDLMIIAGEYEGPYFDGSTIPADSEIERFRWSGAPDESSSIREVRVYEPRPQTDEEYAAAIAPYRRFLHDVAATSGPLVVDIFESKATRGIWGAVMEWTITSERPWIYSPTRPVELPTTSTTVMQDTPYNLVEYPSAELASGDAVVAVNHVTNPSLEVNDAGWVRANYSASGDSASPYLSDGRSTELAAVGAASFRVRTLGDGATEAAGRYQQSAYYDVDLSSLPDGSRVSITVWSACIISAGAAGSSIENVVFYRQFYDAGGSLLGQGEVERSSDASEFGGRVYSEQSRIVPTGAARVRLSVRAMVNWRSSATPANNSDIRLYVDALAVTTP